jgi:tRNA 2-selenouridine synthase
LSVHPISVEAALTHLKSTSKAVALSEPTRNKSNPQHAIIEKISQIIDARSPSEFAHDRIPGAVNWPVLNDEERALIGTMYKQVNSFEAQKKGAGLVAANIARHIEERVLELPRDWQPLLYCWRGGKRSGSLATILGAIGFRVHLLEGGYKAFRTAIIADIPLSLQNLNFHVVCGPTGSGKTLLLHKLKEQGAQVLDLEQIASHRSSVLGKIPGTQQPSQKAFETSLWFALNQFDSSKIIYVESESRKIGNLNVPESLIKKMRSSPCVDLQLPLGERVKLLLDEYKFFVEDGELFTQRLQALVPLLGKEVISRWEDWIQAQETPKVVQELLSLHYDPAYSGSIARNFEQFTSAKACQIKRYSEPEFKIAAQELLMSR